MAVRFYLQLLWFERFAKSNPLQVDRAWNELVAKQASEFRDTAIRLQGLMIKAGQFLSTRADVMPESFTKELKSLTDRVRVHRLQMSIVVYCQMERKLR
jgi:predicted unusual protein kinase regulating ubiquinone biosynthesis (AarF/ABC1/UbiB family)